MTAPLKPWERTNMTTRPPNDNINTMSSPGLTGNDGLLRGATSVHHPHHVRPPPVPTRPSQNRPSPYSGMPHGGYGSMYSPYGGGAGLYGMGGMGGMYGTSPYSPYAHNRYNNYSQGGQNDFVRMAEENSRQAFQSIESIVQAFGSVSMMLESTFAAVYNSFRAVIGVADHFSRMKMHFAQIFSALAVIRTLKWLYRKLLVLLRLREAGVSEEVWASAASNTLSEMGTSGGSSGKGKASWPVMLFFAVVVGGPWLIWRLLRSLTKGAESNKSWANGEADHFVVIALYDFNGEGAEELSFRTGDHIRVAPKGMEFQDEFGMSGLTMNFYWQNSPNNIPEYGHYDLVYRWNSAGETVPVIIPEYELQPDIRGWLLASVDGEKTGLIPANYIKIVGKRQGHSKSAEAGSAGDCEAAAPPQVLAQSWKDSHSSKIPSRSVKFDPAFDDSVWNYREKPEAKTHARSSIVQQQSAPANKQTHNNYGLGDNMETEDPISDKPACDILQDSTVNDKNDES